MTAKKKSNRASFLTLRPSQETRFLSASISTLLASVFLSAPVQALPVGGQVASGEASIVSGAKAMTITAGDRSILNFTKFNIAGDELVKFQQPNATSTVLARATDGTPSQIFGRMEANGRVVLANAAGIYFGSGSVISVGGLIAAAGTVTDEAFLRNNGQLSFQLTGAVENAGQITAEESVVLLGRTVSNTGSIVAPNGVVAMVSGDNVLLSEEGGDVVVVQNQEANASGAEVTLAGSGATNTAASGADAGAGVTQAGRVSARKVFLGAGDLYAVGVRHTGTTKAAERVQVEAVTKAVVSGEIDVASTTQSVDGPQTGSINISADTVEVTGARLSAQGNVQGGEISIAGNTVSVDAESILDVSGVDRGRAGSIEISGWDSLRVDGSLLARGGELGGDGGKITLNSNGPAPSETRVTDVSAPAGEAGAVVEVDLSTETVPQPFEGTLTGTEGGTGVGVVIITDPVVPPPVAPGPGPVGDNGDQIDDSAAGTLTLGGPTGGTVMIGGGGVQPVVMYSGGVVGGETNVHDLGGEILTLGGIAFNTQGGSTYRGGGMLERGGGVIGATNFASGLTITGGAITEGAIMGGVLRVQSGVFSVGTRMAEGKVWSGGLNAASLLKSSAFAEGASGFLPSPGANFRSAPVLAFGNGAALSTPVGIGESGLGGRSRGSFASGDALSEGVFRVTSQSSSSENPQASGEKQ